MYKRMLLTCLVYGLIFVSCFFVIPPEKKILNTKIECLNDSNSDTKKCVYCWNKPSDLNLKAPIEIQFPANNSQILTTKSCIGLPCQDALQMFSQVGDSETIPEITNYLNLTNSHFSNQYSQKIKLNPEYYSWKLFVNTSQDFVLPYRFDYITNQSMRFYSLIDGAFVAATIILILVCLPPSNWCFKLRNKQLLIGTLVILTFYMTQNFIQSRILSIIFMGVTKGLLIYYIMNSVCALSGFGIFSKVLMISTILVSLYEAIFSNYIFLSNIFLFVTIILLIERVCMRKSGCTKDLIIAFFSLTGFALSDQVLSIGESHIWRLVRVASLCTGVVLLCMNKMNVVNFEALEIDNQRRYEPNNQQNSMVEVEDTSII